MFISVIAYQILKAAEHRLRKRGNRRSWTKVRDILLTHPRMTVEFDRMDDKKQRQCHHLRLRNRPGSEHRKS